MSLMRPTEWQRANQSLDQLASLVYQKEYITGIIYKPNQVMPRQQGQNYHKIGQVVRVSGTSDNGARTVTLKYQFAYMPEHAGKMLTVSFEPTDNGSYSIVLSSPDVFGDSRQVYIEFMSFYWRGRKGQGEEESIIFSV
jgi:hypothetical protein